jgi:hypothetical protein
MTFQSAQERRGQWPHRTRSLCAGGDGPARELMPAPMAVPRCWERANQVQEEAMYPSLLLGVRLRFRGPTAVIGIRSFHTGVSHGNNLFLHRIAKSWRKRRRNE